MQKERRKHRRRNPYKDISRHVSSHMGPRRRGRFIAGAFNVGARMPSSTVTVSRSAIASSCGLLTASLCAMTPQPFQTQKSGLLHGLELYWRDRFEWLKQSGYTLRPRYNPNWIPSWQGTDKFYFECEDGVELVVSLSSLFSVSPTTDLSVDRKRDGRCQDAGRTASGNQIPQTVLASS